MAKKLKLNLNEFTERTAYFFKCPHCGILGYVFFNPEDKTEQSVLCTNCDQEMGINNK